MRVRTRILGVFAGVATATFSANAADFTLNVPLELKSMHPDFNGARVSCGVYGSVNGKVELIGSGYKDIFDYQVQGGSYSGTVTIAFNATAGMDPALGEKYSCDLLLAFRGRSSYVQNNQIPAFMRTDGPYPRDESQPFVISASGPIPKAPHVAPKTPGKPVERFLPKPR